MTMPSTGRDKAGLFSTFGRDCAGNGRESWQIAPSQETVPDRNRTVARCAGCHARLWTAVTVWSMN